MYRWWIALRHDTHRTRSVQGLEHVGAAVADIHPETALGGGTDCREAVGPQLALAVAVLLLAAALAIFGMRLIIGEVERISRHYATPVAAA